MDVWYLKVKPKFLHFPFFPRKMQVSGATELATRSQGVSEGSNVIKPKEEIEDSYQYEKIRCPCGSTLRNDSMIKVAYIYSLLP